VHSRGRRFDPCPVHQVSEMTEEYIISKEYDGQSRKLYKVNCVQCNNTLFRPKHLIIKRLQFCTPECSSAYQARNRIDCICAQCKVSFKRPQSKIEISKSGLQFCSRECKDTAQRIGGIEEIMPEHYGIGEYSYRSRALYFYGECCKKCNYDDDLRMLDVHHKDGNRGNNILENLEVLCVWCHAMETRKVAQHNWTGKF
jgi:hypothetical protein